MLALFPHMPRPARTAIPAPAEAVEITRAPKAHGPLSRMVRFYCAQADIEFQTRGRAKRAREKTAEREAIAIASVTCDIPVFRYISYPPASGSPFLSRVSRPASLPLQPSQSSIPALLTAPLFLFFLYREVAEVVCTHAGWQIGRGISFYRMRGLHARKGRKGFRKNAISPPSRKTKNAICTWKWPPK